MRLKSIYCCFMVAVFSCIFHPPLYSEERLSSAPYISGDTFRAHCDFIFDETNKELNPKKVAHGNTIFVKTEKLSKFFKKIHPKIRYPYVLVTHNCDHPIPGNHKHMLDDSKLLAWFGQNVQDYTHPKLHPIPIGLANRRWPHGKIEAFSQIREQQKDCLKPHLLYMNFSVFTNSPVRSALYHQFMDKPYCFISSPKPLEEYLTDLAMTQFVLSPSGNGLDCHRTWEALYMGAIPIVSSSASDSLFEGLPVVIIQDWNEVTPSFLEQKRIELSQIPMDRDKLWADYWFQQIDAYK